MAQQVTTESNGSEQQRRLRQVHTSGTQGGGGEALWFMVQLAFLVSPIQLT